MSLKFCMLSCSIRTLEERITVQHVGLSSISWINLLDSFGSHSLNVFEAKPFVALHKSTHALS